MNWLIFTIIATVLAGISPLFTSRNVQILGPIMTMFVNTVFWAVVLSFWLVFNWHQTSLVNKQSLFFTGASQILSIIATFLLFHAFQLATGKLSIIILTTSLAVVVTAVSNSFLGNKLEPHQWLGVVITLMGITLVNLDRTTIQKFFSHLNF